MVDLAHESARQNYPVPGAPYAHGLADRIRRRELTAAAVLQAQLERIEKHNPTLNAVVSLEIDAARRAARAADEAQRRGAPLGPLHGVPITLKDVHDVAGMRTTIGSDFFDRTPEADGTVAARLRAAGAIIVGHTNVPPMLGDYISDNPIFGRTNNPWDLSRTAGGSSGGAAAALAAGLTWLEVGSDLAGSLRVPTHFCGVYGLKTTEHRIPATGFFRPPDGVPQSVRILSALGPMARDLNDLDLALRVLAGPDGVDTDIPPVPLPARAKRPISSLRLAWAPTLPDASVATSLQDTVAAVAAAAAQAGAHVVQRLPAVDWQEQWVFGELLDITQVFAPGAEPRQLSWYLAALARRDRWISAWDAFFGDHDALILPPAATTAFPHDETDTDHQGLMSVFANLAGLPALTVPAGHDDQGLPIGVQLVGPRWSEVQLLDVAAALEAAAVLPGFTIPPTFL